ncbi:MAG: DEAD/DEAH box helicase [Chloroflexota bacterium]
MSQNNNRSTGTARTGTIKWYNRSRGFGFIIPDGGGEELFVHHSAIPRHMQSELDEGQRVAFGVEQRKKGPAATAVERLNGVSGVSAHNGRGATAGNGASRANGKVVTDNTVGNNGRTTNSANAFAALGLHPDLLRAVRQAGYGEPTPIQSQAIPRVLAGIDVSGCAQTGTGKTAAFALPILHHLLNRPSDKRRPVRALVLAPTRELAIQIADSFSTYGRFTGLRNTTIYGGVSQRPQVNALRRGVDIVVATPGRLLDLMNQCHLQLDQVELLVLDEADRMLDMGFIHDVRRIVREVKKQRQTLLFSATMPREVVNLANSIMQQPQQIAVTPEQPTVDAIEQAVYFVSKKKKQALLEHVLQEGDVSRALVFTRTKRGANRVVQRLQRAGISADPIHGNKSQSARQRSLKQFRNGNTRVLVATDVVARGIDVDEISHVIQYDLPNEPETYVHRIGRTGRAGASGAAFAFCADDERSHLRQIERLLGQTVPPVHNHPHV